MGTGRPGERQCPRSWSHHHDHHTLAPGLAALRHGAGPADPVGCRGIHVPGHTACLAHLTDTDRDTYLAGLAPGADIDHCGTTVRRQALTELRARTATTYLTAVTDALRTAGLTTDTAPAVEQTREDRLRAAVLLTPDAPAPAVVWEEDTGWRTASRRHPYTAPDTCPLLPGTPQPAPDALLAALAS
ncbi:hypothetical protein GCM10017562_00790 [Streptomyces roseofulvus]|uniref:DUF6292 family protein n=1 Tax=Streptomyces roseofulvus TaxID=33902 RepID=UPI0031F76BAA